MARKIEIKKKEYIFGMAEFKNLLNIYGSIENIVSRDNGVTIHMKEIIESSSHEIIR